MRRVSVSPSRMSHELSPSGKKGTRRGNASGCSGTVESYGAITAPDNCVRADRGYSIGRGSIVLDFVSSPRFATKKQNQQIPWNVFTSFAQLARAAHVVSRFPFFPDGFKSDVKLWCRMLLPGTAKRVYNLQSKQLVKLFSRLLLHSENEMLEHLEKGDVAETIRTFFERSSALKPAPKSALTIQEVKSR